MSRRVVVVGSINVDLVVSADHVPERGETVLGSRFEQHFGGKGANQAVAAARAGASVTLIGAVGEDAYGTASIDALAGEGIDVSQVRRVPAPTGVALIAVGRTGENQIVVAPGANSQVRPEDVTLSDGDRPTVVVTGFEVPLATASAALRRARAANALAILNPAPSAFLGDDVLGIGAHIVLNEQEVCVAAGKRQVDDALDRLAQQNWGPVVLTRGSSGAVLADGERRKVFAGIDVPDVVDTTGAGDAFIGVLAAWLADGKTLEQAVTAANAAAAMSVQRAGAREGMPRLEQLTALLADA